MDTEHLNLGTRNDEALRAFALGVTQRVLPIYELHCKVARGVPHSVLALGRHRLEAGACDTRVLRLERLLNWIAPNPDRDGAHLGAASRVTIATLNALLSLHSTQDVADRSRRAALHALEAVDVIHRMMAAAGTDLGPVVRTEKDVQQQLLRECQAGTEPTSLEAPRPWFPFKSYCERYGIDVDDEDVDATRYVASFRPDEKLLHFVFPARDDGSPAETAAAIEVPEFGLANGTLSIGYKVVAPGLSRQVAEYLLTTTLVLELADDHYRADASEVAFCDLSDGSRRALPYPGAIDWTGGPTS